MSSDPDITATIRSREAARLDAMCNRDIGVLEDILAPDFRYTHSDGSIDGKDDIIARVRGDAVRYRDGRFESLDIRLYDGVAVVNGHFRLTVEAPQGTFHLNSRSQSVWVRSREAWQQVATASTPIRTPVAPGAEARP